MQICILRIDNGVPIPVSSQSRFSYFLPIPACSRMAVSVARPLSVSVYAPVSRSCAMNPRMAMDCIACAVTAA